VVTAVLSYLVIGKKSVARFWREHDVLTADYVTMLSESFQLFRRSKVSV